MEDDRPPIKRIIRDRHLTPEEVEKYRKIRELIELDKDDLIAQHHARMEARDKAAQAMNHYTRNTVEYYNLSDLAKKHLHTYDEQFSLELAVGGTGGTAIHLIPASVAKTMFHRFPMLFEGISDDWMINTILPRDWAAS